VLTSHDLLYTGRAELGAAPNDQQHERRTNRAEDVFGDLVAAGEHHQTSSPLASIITRSSVRNLVAVLSSRLF
jgi:hypothetical protein